MSMHLLTRTAVALAAIALVTACGGGSDAPASAAEAFGSAAVGARAGSDPLRHAAAASGGGESGAAAVTITVAQFFQGAEALLPDTFPTSTPPVASEVPYEGKVYQVRAYRNGNYLAVASDGRVYGLGAFTGGTLTAFDLMQNYGDLVCSRISCSTGGGTGGGTGGTLNDCTLPTAQALTAGSRADLVYTYSGILSGDQTIASVVDGPGTFRGQSATQVTTTTTGSNTISQGGFTITVTTTTRSRSYSQAGSNGLMRTLGALIDATTSTPFPSVPGLPSLPPTVTTVSSEVFYTPATENTEFTLSVGQSLTKTENITTTVTAGAGSGSGPLVVTSNNTHTFEARESITVPAGTFSTCRYRVTGADGGSSQSWFIVGKGIMAKSQSTATGGTQTIQLRSGTVNGQRL